jgi:hypothetical protein
MSISRELGEAMRGQRAGTTEEPGKGRRHPAPFSKEQKVVDPFLEKVLDALEDGDQEAADESCQKAVELLYSKFGYDEAAADRYVSAWFDWQGE